MTAPQAPTAEQQAQAPAAQAPTQAPVPEQAAEDRILSPDETENLLRGYNLVSDAEQRQRDAADTPPDQQQMAGDFFSEIPGERTPAQMPPALPPQVPGQVAAPYEQMAAAQQVPGQPLAPGAPPAGFIEQAAAQTPVGPTPGVPQAPVYVPGSQIPAGAQQQVPVQTQQTPEYAALQAQNQMLMQQVGQIRQEIQQQAQPAPAQRPGYQAPGEPAPQTYNFNVPPQFLAAIQSEDQTQAAYALNTLMNNVAETVTQQVRREQQALREEVGGMVQTTVQRSGTEQEIQRDMYGTYPELAGHRDFVQAAARRLSQTMGNQTPWSADLRDQIAESVAPMVPGLYQKIQQVKAQRIGAYAVPQQMQQMQPQYQQAQTLPQQTQPLGLPPGVQPVGMVGAMHGQPPVLARDASGNLVHIPNAPQPYLGSAQARQSGSAVPPEVMDIWRTLGYEPY